MSNIRMKKTFILISLFLVVCSTSSSAQTEIPKLPIINGIATSLLKPIYPPEAENYCAEGKVEVEVSLDSDGRVIAAKAVSGDELLYESALTSAKQATFGRIVPGKPQHGLIVYTFVSPTKCIDVGNINKKAKSIPKPVIPFECHCSGSVDVFVVINESGNVISARAFSGHPLLRKSAETSAIKAKFPPTFINAQSLKAKAILTYSFAANGDVTY